MLVPVMDIGKVRVAVSDRCVVVQVVVGFSAIPFEVVFMLVMLVMGMSMAVHQRFMLMLVCMVLGQVYPDTQRHQRGGDPEQP